MALVILAIVTMVILSVTSAVCCARHMAIVTWIPSLTVKYRQLARRQNVINRILPRLRFGVALPFRSHKRFSAPPIRQQRFDAPVSGLSRDSEGGRYLPLCRVATPVSVHIRCEDE
jgi:hypothetical protein